MVKFLWEIIFIPIEKDFFIYICHGVLYICLNINNSKLVENPDSSSEKAVEQMIIPLYKDETVYMNDKKMERT